MAREAKRRSAEDDEDRSSAKRAKRDLQAELGMTQRAINLGHEYDELSDTYDNDSSEDESDVEWGAQNGYDESTLDDSKLERLWDKELERREKQEHAKKDRRDRTQMVASKYDDNAGWVKEIRLVDFMCHRNLSVKIGKNLNFLVGHNGSGKSAILTALSIAMGGKATTTKRANGVKDFIRGQEAKAVITVVLHNQGYNAYKPDVYPENIWIERTITRSSGGGWKFRADPADKPVSVKRAELDGIRAAFIIDCDQPLTVLTQDMARAFLKESDASQLYKFFLVGTGLKAISEKYDQARDNITLARSNAANQKTTCDVLEKEQKALKGIVQQHAVLQQQRDELERLQVKKKWAEVDEKEEALATVKQKIEAIISTITEKTADLEIKEADLEKAAKDIKVIEDAMTASNATKHALETKVEAAKKKRDTARQEVDQHDEQSDENRRSIDVCQNDISELEADIQEQRATLANGEDEATQITRKKLAQGEAAQRNIVMKLEPTRAALVQAENAAENARQARDRANDKKMEANRDVESAEAMKQKAEQAGRDSLSRFGRGLDRVLADIDRQTWRGVKPIGPIGRHVKLKSNDRGVRLLFTHLLGNLMTGFIVTNSQDRGNLQDLLNKHMQQGQYSADTNPRGARRTGPIIYNSGDLFDFSTGDRASFNTNETRTILSALAIDQELVLRVLIIQNRIEQQFYCTAPRDIANSDLSNRLVPKYKNVTVHSTDYITLRADGPGQTTASPWICWDPIFVNDTEAEVQVALGKLVDAKAERDKVYAAAEAAVQADHAAKQAVQKRKMEVENFKIGYDKLERLIEAMKKELPSDDSIDIEANEQLLKDRQAQLSVLQVTLDRGKELRQGLQAKLDEAGQAYKEARDNQINAEPQRIENEAALQNLSTKHTMRKREIEVFRTALQRMDAQLKEAEIARNAATAELEAMTQEANEAGPREAIDVEEAGHDGEREAHDPAHRHPKFKISVKKIIVAIAQVEKKIAKNSASNRNELERAKEKLTRVEQKIQRIKKDVDEFERGVRKLEDTIDDREQFWLRLRAEATIKARVIFIKSMAKRQFEGRIAIRHSSSELVMGVIAKVTAQQDGETSASSSGTQYKSASVLSGGERSFSTVSLLLALWESAGGPLRCLDEWDVFLDGVNRDLAASMLIEGAQSSTGKQYILITPQNMGKVNIEDGDNKIIRLADPERNQGTLGFGNT